MTKALESYSQVDIDGVPGKRRKIVHLEEDIGCGCEWYTMELSNELLNR